MSRSGSRTLPAALVTLISLAPPLSAQQIAPPAEALQGRQVVLVTGSTSGLGREVALAMGQRGAHVIVHGRNRDRGLEVVEEIAAGPGTATFYAADFASMALGRQRTP